VFCANIYGQLDGGMVTTALPLEVFAQRNFVADLYTYIRLKLNFNPKNEIIAF